MSVRRFSKMDDELRELGVSRSLVDLYGVLERHVGSNGECWPTHETLARGIGLRSKRSGAWVNELLKQLRDLRLVEWKRDGPHPNRYVVLKPDRKWIEHWMQGKKDVKKTCYLDVKKTCYRIESSSKDPDTTEKRSVKSTVVARKKPNQKSSRLDDEPGGSAEHVLALRLRRLHGPDFDVELCLRNIRRHLEPASLDLGDFEPYDRTHTTGKRFTNRQGYYVHLAQALVKETRMAVRNGTHAAIPKPPEPERNAKGRCAACSGSGLLADGAFCGACSLGRDLAGLAARKPRARGHTA